MATKQLSPMSPGTRRRIINYIVNKHLGLTNAAWWGEESANNPVGAAYQQWALEAEPPLRAALEAMTGEALMTEYELCHKQPACLEFFIRVYELQEQQEEIARRRAYHLSLSQKGGHAHQSRSQPDILAACQAMYVADPKISAKKAYNKLAGGHVALDGKAVAFRSPLTFETFRTRYWPRRRAKC